MSTNILRDRIREMRAERPEPALPSQPLTLCFRSLVIGVFLGAGLNILAMLAGLYWA